VDIGAFKSETPEALAKMLNNLPIDKQVKAIKLIEETIDAYMDTLPHIERYSIATYYRILLERAMEMARQGRAGDAFLKIVRAKKWPDMERHIIRAIQNFIDRLHPKTVNIDIDEEFRGAVKDIEIMHRGIESNLENLLRETYGAGRKAWLEYAPQYVIRRRLEEARELGRDVAELRRLAEQKKYREALEKMAEIGRKYKHLFSEVQLEVLRNILSNLAKMLGYKP
jgi:AraC-like DNA-binding protein